LKDDCGLETVVTWWQIMQKTGFRQQRTYDMTCFKLWREAVWKRSGIAVKLNVNPTHPVNLILSDPRKF
jgi:hypothetical protein